MRKFKSLIYVHEKTSCPLLYQIFNHEFQLSVTHKKEEFLDQALNKDIDIGIYNQYILPMTN